MKLSDLVGRKEAAKLVKRSIPTMRKLHDAGELVGIPVGGDSRPQSFVYTKRQLAAYQRGEIGQPTADEIAAVLDVSQAAALAEMSVRALKKQADAKETIPSRTVAGVQLFLRTDVEAFTARRRQILAEMEARVTVTDGRVGDFDLAGAITGYRQAHGLSQQVLGDRIGGDLGESQRRQLISKIERRETVHVREDVYGRLVAIVRGE